MRANTLRFVKWERDGIASSRRGRAVPGRREGTAITPVDGGRALLLVGGWAHGWPPVRNDLVYLDVCPLDPLASADLRARAALRRAVADPPPPPESPDTPQEPEPIDVTAEAAGHLERLLAEGLPGLSVGGVGGTAWRHCDKTLGSPMRPRYGHSATTIRLPHVAQQGAVHRHLCASPSVTSGESEEAVLVFGGHFTGGYTGETASASLVLAAMSTVVLDERQGEEVTTKLEEHQGGAAVAALPVASASSAPVAFASSAPASDLHSPWYSRNMTATWQALRPRRGAAATARGYHAAVWVPSQGATLVCGGISEGESCWALEALTLLPLGPAAATPAPTAGGAASSDAAAADGDETEVVGPFFELDAVPFETSGESPSPRHGHSASLLPPTARSPAGALWVCGGADGGDILREGSEMRDVHLLDIATRAWTTPRLAPPALPRWVGRCHTATVVGEKILIFGGNTRVSNKVRRWAQSTSAGIPQVDLFGAPSSAFLWIPPHSRCSQSTHALSPSPPLQWLPTAALRPARDTTTVRSVSGGTSSCSEVCASMRTMHAPATVGAIYVPVCMYAGISAENSPLGDTRLLHLAPRPPAAGMAPGGGAAGTAMPEEVGEGDAEEDDADDDEEGDDEEGDNEEEEEEEEDGGRALLLRMILQQIFGAHAQAGGGEGTGGSRASSGDDDDDAAT